MPPASRFGASKYRNAVPHIPAKEEWYRFNLPATSTSTSATSTFSSEIKTNHHGIYTLTPAGEFTFRSYDSRSAEGVKVQKGLGSRVGDWDVSRVEGGGVVVGSLDGAISVYGFSKDKPEPLELAHTIPGSSPITSLALHPTTPNILLASTVSVPLGIYNLSSPTSPALTLHCAEPKGLWTAAWSADGRRIAAIGRSGQGYIYDPRSSVDPSATRTLPLQPLKPCRVAWIGDNVIVTSTSKMRNREYSLFSGTDLKTIFTQTLDTSPGLLVPQIDEERQIIYLSGKGDSTLRQVELSGPQGYQEAVHSLPAPLPSGSFSLAHPTTLPVMQAQIETILIPTGDKDGDALVPFGIKVPRRFLIDYHEDLFPDITGFVSEQSAEDWLNGEDRMPLPISLDPSRRSEWEKHLSGSSPKPASTAKSNAELSSAPPTQTSAETKPAPSSAVLTAPAETKPAAPVAPAGNADLPPLEGDETFASTSYKARIIGRHIGDQVEKHRKAGKKGPLMVGLQGPQGCGKTTLCRAFLDLLTHPPHNLKLAVLSLDDLYKTHSGLKDIAAKHPDNALLQGRGPPGTHDVNFAAEVVARIEKINNTPGTTVDLPIFDKSLCGGEGDRSTETVPVTGPLDVFILEGWSMGFSALASKVLEERYSSRTSLTDTSYFSSQPLSSLNTLNDYLDEFASRVYPSFETIIQVEPKSYEFIFSWRLEQERNMKASNGGKGMDDDAVRRFVERYMPGYELWKDGIKSGSSPWAGSGVVLTFDKGREVVKVEQLREMSTSSTSSKPSEGFQSTVPTAAAAALRTIQKIPQPAVQPSKPVNPNWSRKFLSGKSPLIPTYDQVPALSTLHQDSLVLRCSSHLALFPISGPGGRLAVHPLSKTGRMDKEEVKYLSGGVDIADFAVEEFSGDETRVAIAGEDGTVRVWRTPQKGLEASGKEADMVLKGNESKITQVAFHPTANGLLSAISSDSIYLFDLSTGDLALSFPIDSKGGAYNITWSPTGSQLAMALKDHRLAVLDPRNPSSVIYGQAHDSPRSFQVAWVDETHLLSVGFARGSSRKIILYEVLEKEIKTISSLLIDTSPSVLFPTYDTDTSILYIWGKGERQIQAYEIQPDSKNEPIAKLPSFTAASPQLGVAFLGKRMVDVKKVEVAKGLRLTAKSIEEVSFSIPRNKPDFFQDDIFVNTLDIETPLQSAKEWLDGGKPEAKYISLQPEGMTPLSQAPQTPAKAKTKFVPARDIMTEEQKKQQAMDNLFAKAKLDESSDEDVTPKGGLDPPDDDW